MPGKNWFESYQESHRHRFNRLAHYIGIPLILLAIPLVFFHWRAALGMFVVGWLFQFLGHAIEGKAPSFLKDPTYLLVGPLYFFRKLIGADRKPVDRD